MRPHGRAKVNSRSPEAWGICDNCSFLYNLNELRWQMQWAGNKLVNLRQLVCRRCNDIPQTQLRAIIIPADPMPVMNPRPQNYQAASTDNRTTSGQNTVDPRTGIPIPGNTMRITEDDEYRVTQQTGAPNESLNELPGTDPNAVTYRTISNAIGNGSGRIRLTVNTTSGMITGQNVTIGDVVGTTEANGNWTITVVNLTTVDLDNSTFTNAYSSGGYIVNNPALPYGFTEIPRTGPL
tara:strand:+ start:1525 stop:2235 length:711 start_codon:yes stop_codon:yes gene_type:complete